MGKMKIYINKRKEFKNLPEINLIVSVANIINKFGKKIKIIEYDQHKAVFETKMHGHDVPEYLVENISNMLGAGFNVETITTYTFDRGSSIDRAIYY